MKKYLLFVICICLAFTAMGQENPTITQQLKEKYSMVYFRNGFYHVTNTKRGVCDIRGRELVPCKYDMVTTIDYKETGCFNVEQNGKKGVWSVELNKEIVPCRYESIFLSVVNKKEGFIEVKQNGKVGLWSLAEGKESVPCIYEYISLLYYNKGDKYIEVEQNGKKGLYKLNEGEIIPCKYDDISENKENGCFDVTLNKKKGLLNEDGKELIPCRYDNSLSYRYKKGADFVEVELNEKIGLYRVGDREIIPNKYDFIFEKDEYATVEKDDLYGLYSLKDGKEIIKCQYHYLGNPTEGLLVFQKDKDGKYGYMDIKQKVIIAPEYDSAQSFKDGVAQVTKNGVTSIIKHPLHGTKLDVASGVDVWVDNDIPQTSIKNEEGFAFIIANENYVHLTGADYSHNDGKVLAEYCKKTLGFPENNVRYYEDATYGNMMNALKQLKDIADVYDGEAKIIFYFSGLGTIDEKTREKYILPSDASFAALNTTGYSLSSLMKTLNELKTKYTLLIIDAPFNRNGKTGKSLAAGRGVMIANKGVQSHDNVVGLIGSENGNNYSSKQLQHGILTYSLLETMKKTKGDCTLKELLDTSCLQVKKESLKQFKEMQTPVQVVSEKQKTLLTTIKL